MKTTPDERRKLRLVAGMATEDRGRARAMLRLLDDVEELERREEESGERLKNAAMMLTRLCRDDMCPVLGVLNNCPHGSICNRVTTSEWGLWLEGKK